MEGLSPVVVILVQQCLLPRCSEMVAGVPFSRHWGFGGEGDGEDDTAAPFSNEALMGRLPCPICWFQSCCALRACEAASVL